MTNPVLESMHRLTKGGTHEVRWLSFGELALIVRALEDVGTDRADRLAAAFDGPIEQGLDVCIIKEVSK